MSKEYDAHAETGKTKELSPKQQQERKDRVLTKGTPSVVSSIADAVVIKDGNLFFLTQPDGAVPEENPQNPGKDHTHDKDKGQSKGHGYGLYYHDCRYLNSYVLELAGAHPNPLVSAAGDGYQSVFQLSNPDIRMSDDTLIEKDHLGIEWTHMVDGQKVALMDRITFRNYGLKECKFPVTLRFNSAFEDVFDIRGLLSEKPGKLREPKWKDGALSLVYDGTDGLYRSVCIYFSQQPASTDGTCAQFNLTLQPRESLDLLVIIWVEESPKLEEVQPQGQAQSNFKGTAAALHKSAQDWLDGQMQVTTGSLLFNNILARAQSDLRMLRSSLGGEEYFAAGLPWFGTLFGRDSATTAIQTLAYRPGIAEQTLCLLAKYQGDRIDEYRDEQPGKILHSTRVGELARTGQIPHSPYYGTVDATLLFLILMGQYAEWTGDLGLFRKLRDNVERALNWMTEYGDLDHDGYIEYASTSKHGLINQGWKDSGDAIVNADGSLATPPIALVEVQGYAYLARLSIAALYSRAGEQKQADKLKQEAEKGRARFNKDFWLEDKGFYALALQKDKKPCAVLSSNPGQALWTGIADDDKARRTVESLTSEHMYNGWGIRTLSDQERRYNPIGYHLGTVWPHDNSLIAAGFRRYGHDDAALKVYAGIIGAAMNFTHYRLPEVFAGFDRKTYGVPVHYPVACHPQAWAAGSILYIVQTMLGLQAEAFDNRLRVVRPILPDFIDKLDLKGLRVGKASADLHFHRDAHGIVQAEVSDAQGGLDVQVEAANEREKVVAHGKV